ncbi:MAG: SGNH/GDSL hydrolase family protein [Planctomycetes bacterium]|nr:SGNH/GDSL hydrolase family protein [Planctomycetota bacterium]
MRPAAAVAGLRALAGPAALAALPALAACSAAPHSHDRAVPSSPGEATAEDAQARSAHRWDVPPPGRVLMVGNSFTFWNGGLWRPLAAALDSEGRGVTVEPCVEGGASLETHWHRDEVLDRIDAGEADVVVLQGDIPESTLASFEEHAGKLIELVRDAGARPVLFMTWDYERLGWLSLEEIITAHRGVALGQNVQVVPVGEAFGIARRERPDLDLYAADREHPSQAGSFLALVMLAMSLGADDVESIVPPRRWRQLAPLDLAYLRDLGQRVCEQETRRVRELHGSKAFCPN